MDRTKLREAILGISEHDDVLTMNEVDHRDFRMVIAAACAYACERCDGKGEVMTGRYVTYAINEFAEQSTPVYDKCPDCAEFRRIADGGGE